MTKIIRDDEKEILDIIEKDDFVSLEKVKEELKK
jgi:hypothetical protein